MKRGRAGLVRQWRMAAKQLNSETSCDPRLLTYSNHYSQPGVRKTFFTSLVPQPAENHTSLMRHKKDDFILARSKKTVHLRTLVVLWPLSYL